MELEEHKIKAAELQAKITRLQEELRTIESTVVQYCAVNLGTRVTRSSTRAGSKLETAEIRDITASYSATGNVNYAFYGRLVKTDGTLSNKMIRLWRHANWRIINGGLLYEHESI